MIFERDSRGRIKKPDLSIKVLRKIDEQEEEPQKCFDYIDKFASPWSEYFEAPEETKKKYLGDEIMGDASYEPSDLVQNAIEWYKGWLEEICFDYRMYRSALSAGEKLIKYLNSVDLAERTNSGAMVHKPKDIPKIISQTKETCDEIRSLKKSTIEEVRSGGSTTADRKINYFEKDDV